MDINKFLPSFVEEVKESPTIVKGIGEWKSKSITDEDGTTVTYTYLETPSVEECVGVNLNSQIEEAVKEDAETEGLGERQKSVYTYLKSRFPEGASAKELSNAMFKDSLVPSPERNSVHPRLNELISLDLVKIIGTKTCQFTERKVSIYSIKQK
jgi:hypothetical protein